MQSNLKKIYVAFVLVVVATISFAAISEYRAFGTVTDLKGKPIAGAKLTLTNKADGSTINIKSKDDGTFDQQFIPRGMYSLSIEKEGYAPRKVDTLDFSLKSEKTVQKKIDVQLMTPEDEEQMKMAGEAAKMAKEVQEGYKKGVAEFQAKNYDAALATMQQVAQKAPDAYGPYLIMAGAYDAKGDCDNAIKYYEKTISLKSDIEEAYVYLGSCYIKKKDYAKATATYKKALELRPADLESQCVLANLQLAMDNAAEAQTNIDAAMNAAKDAQGNVNPAAALCFKVNGEILLKKGDMKGGAASLKKYLELNPNAPDKASVQETIQALEQTK